MPTEIRPLTVMDTADMLGGGMIPPELRAVADARALETFLLSEMPSAADVRNFVDDLARRHDRRAILLDGAHAWVADRERAAVLHEEVHRGG